MKYYAVIDTNVLISAMLKQGSLPWMVIDAIKKDIIIPLLNDEIIEEYNDVSRRNNFNFSESTIENVVGGIIKKSVILDRITSDEKFIDSSDAVFYEIVMCARQKNDAYLVTGNIKHFPKKRFVVTPREMLEIIGLV